MSKTFIRSFSAFWFLVLSACNTAPYSSPLSRIGSGMSEEEVKQALGSPQLIVRTGPEELRYYYNFNQVDFVNGGVSRAGPYENTVNVYSRRKLNPLEVGMSREEAIFLIGGPTSRRGGREQETLVYNLCVKYEERTLLDPLCVSRADHWVILVNGKITQFGLPDELGIDPNQLKKGANPIAY